MSKLAKATTSRCEPDGAHIRTRSLAQIAGTCGHWASADMNMSHHLGYAADHHYDVQPVCTKCHSRRAIARGELRPLNWTGKETARPERHRPRRANGTFMKGGGQHGNDNEHFLD